MFGDELAVAATIMLQPLNLFDRIVANLFVFFGIGAILVYAYGAQIQDQFTACFIFDTNVRISALYMYAKNEIIEAK